MKVVISTTTDDKYLFYLPIVSWCWQKLGVDVICFSHNPMSQKELNVILNCPSGVTILGFNCPEHKAATYAQCSRLFAAAIKVLADDEILITSDIDMLVFNKDFIKAPVSDFFDVYGTDLVPPGQLPMCYVVGLVSTWRRFFTKGRSYQECLDDELAHEECENMRGNLWARDQELLFKGVGLLYFSHERAAPGTQFATKRIDRDDAYFMDRLSPDTIDYHMHRPGYEDSNFEKILSVIQHFYPNDDLTWMRNYQQAYKELL